jgi:cytochrome c biogenesis protein ResB
MKTEHFSSETETETETENESYPVKPGYHPVHKIPRKIYNFFASAKLAMTLLVVILCCCLAGVTIWRGVMAGRVIFSTLWFNGLLVLLVINVACCFFGRIWGRRVTVISFGMILFHISFVLVFLGIVYNSLFCFRGNIRLTEGETLVSGDPKSYDIYDAGRFFSFSRLKGETTLVSMHSDYKVGNEDKRAAYEIEVGGQGDKKNGMIYITHKLSHHGVDYFNDREGHSLLVTLGDKAGKELYGGYIPLQSVQRSDKSSVYVTGYKEGDKIVASPLNFPVEPEQPKFGLQVAFSKSKVNERSGDVEFQVYRLPDNDSQSIEKPLFVAKKTLNEVVFFDEYQLAAREVRYWVGMSVRYEPGKPIVLTSLWVGLAGMIITTLGRMFRKGVRG